MKCGGYHGNLHTVIHQTNPVTLFQFKLPVENTGSGTQNKPLAHPGERLFTSFHRARLTPCDE